MCKRYLDQLPLTCPHLRTWPATQACALTRNQTSDPLIYSLVLKPLSHTSQGLNVSLTLNAIDFLYHKTFSSFVITYIPYTYIPTPASTDLHSRIFLPRIFMFQSASLKPTRLRSSLPSFVIPSIPPAAYSEFSQFIKQLILSIFIM